MNIRRMAMIVAAFTLGGMTVSPPIRATAADTPLPITNITVSAGSVNLRWEDHGARTDIGDLHLESAGSLAGPWTEVQTLAKSFGSTTVARDADIKFFRLYAEAPFVPVTDITGVPNVATAGVPLALTGTVSPGNATYQAIVWSVPAPASINGNDLTAPDVGTVTVTATISNGSAIGTDYVKNFEIYAEAPFVPVTDITGVPNVATAGVPLALTGTVSPGNATYQAIVWSVPALAFINGNDLTVPDVGTVTVTATISNGYAIGTDYVKNFEIYAEAPFVPVTDITGVPNVATAGVPLALTGTVSPGNATYQAIVWSVPAPAFINGNDLTVPDVGTVTVTATISNGSAIGTDYVKNFEIYAEAPFVPVTDITGVPNVTTAGVPLALTGTVSPGNAIYQAIVWSVPAPAFINGNVLTAPDPGTVTVTATISNGSAIGTDYVKNFEIYVAPFVSVTDITGVPTEATAGVPLALTGTVSPGNAIYQAIVWSVPPQSHDAFGRIRRASPPSVGHRRARGPLGVRHRTAGGGLPLAGLCGGGVAEIHRRADGGHTPHPDGRLAAPPQGNVRFFKANNVIGLFEQGAYQGRHGEFAEIQCMYAPEFNAHSASETVESR